MTVKSNYSKFILCGALVLSGICASSSVLAQEAPADAQANKSPTAQQIGAKIGGEIGNQVGQIGQGIGGAMQKLFKFGSDAVSSAAKAPVAIADGVKNTVQNPQSSVDSVLGSASNAASNVASNVASKTTGVDVNAAKAVVQSNEAGTSSDAPTTTSSNTNSPDVLKAVSNLGGKLADKISSFRLPSAPSNTNTNSERMMP